MNVDSQMNADYARAQRVASLATGMASMTAPVFGAHIDVSLQPSPSSIPDQPILASVPLGGHEVGPLEMRYILYTLQNTHNSLHAITRDNK